jgi:hypothetical protein
VIGQRVCLSGPPRGLPSSQVGGATQVLEIGMVEEIVTALLIY